MKKNIKIEYGRNRYHNMSEEKKQKLKQQRRNYRVTKKLKQKKLTFFLFIVKEIEQKALYFGENGIIKNGFIKTKEQLILTLFRMGFFWTAHGLGEDKKAPPP